MTLFDSAIEATRKGLASDPWQFLAAVSLGGLGSLRPAESVVTGGIILFVLLMLDLWSGATAAIYRKEFDGNKLFMRTVAKMTGYACSLIAVYGVIWGLAQATQFSEVVRGEGVSGAMMVVISLLILHEARSVLLNSAKMDLPILGYVGRWLKKKEMKAKASLLDEE